MDDEPIRTNKPIKTCKHSTPYGMSVDKNFCRWHANFVQNHSGMFPWSCADRCVLEHYQEGTDPGNLPLDETMTINEAKMRIGEQQWELMKSSPKDIAVMLGKRQHQRDPSPVGLLPEGNTVTPVESTHKSVNRDSRLFQLVAKTVLCATAGLDYEIDYSEDLYELLENSRVEDSVEIMMLASFYINFLHYQAISKIDFEATSLKERFDLLIQLNGEFNKSCKLLESYKQKQRN